MPILPAIAAMRQEWTEHAQSTDTRGPGISCLTMRLREDNHPNDQASARPAAAMLWYKHHQREGNGF